MKKVLICLLLVFVLAVTVTAAPRYVIDGEDLLSDREEQLLDQQEEIQSRIAMAQSEESILQWAQSQGMVQISN
jgi:hypothetical protein